VSAHVVDDAVRELARLRAINAELLEAAHEALEQMHRVLAVQRTGFNRAIAKLDAAIQHAESPS